MLVLITSFCLHQEDIKIQLYRENKLKDLKRVFLLILDYFSSYKSPLVLKQTVSFRLLSSSFPPEKLNIRAESERVEKTQQVLTPIESHSTWEAARLWPMKAAAGVKLNHEFSEVQARACCAALLSEGSMRGWCDCWCYADTGALVFLHKRVTLSVSTQSVLRQE